MSTGAYCSSLSTSILPMAYTESYFTGYINSIVKETNVMLKEETCFVDSVKGTVPHFRKQAFLARVIQYCFCALNIKMKPGGILA